MEGVVKNALPSLKRDEINRVIEMFKDLGVETEDDLKYVTLTDIDKSILKPIQARKLLEYSKDDAASSDSGLGIQSTPEFGAPRPRRSSSQMSFRSLNEHPVERPSSSRQQEKYQRKPNYDAYGDESANAFQNQTEDYRYFLAYDDQQNGIYEDDDEFEYGNGYGQPPAFGNYLQKQRSPNNRPEKINRGPRIGRISANANTINNECNILILGETGVGKSTFINSFANYLTYSSLQEAQVKDLISLIPTTFTVTDQDYKERHVKFGNDANESGKIGGSQTQACRDYEFQVGDITVRLIDTPGIGDTSGIDQDTENFKKIIAHISNYSVLNGILILLKPNNARLTVLFRFCIQELLGHLHKSASHNIVFLFTNARSTFYRPGDTLPSLRQMLDKTANTPPHVQIKLDMSTIYCLDNEAFRFLVALKSNVFFDEKEKKNFAESWEKSVEECQRLLEYVIGLHPHTIDDTISLYEAKQIVLLLARPLCDISLIIQTNIDLAKDQERRIKAAGDDIAKLKDALFYDYVDLEPVTYEEPRTVCTSVDCVTVRTLSDKTVTDYTTVCHDPCYLKNVEKERTNNEALRSCAAMNGTENCVKCGCSYEKHMHIYYKNVEKTSKKKDSNVESEITSKEQARQQQMQALNECKERQRKQMQEQDTITNASAQIAHFLWANAIIMHNDATKDYLEHLLILEKQKCALDPANKKQVEHLQRIMAEYEQQCKIIENSLKHQKDPKQIFTPQMIRELQRKLFSMELNGDYIRKAVQGQLNGIQKENKALKTNFSQPRRSNKKNTTYANFAKSKLYGFWK